MYQTSVAQLVEDNREKLSLSWLGGERGGSAAIRQDPHESAAFIGHLNLIHPLLVQVLAVNTAGMLVRREVFDAIGVMDEQYFLYYEEVDFMLLAARAGWPTWCRR